MGQSNLFACKDRAAPDRSVGSEKRTVIGQQMREERGRRAEDQPGRAIETQPRDGREETKKKELGMPASLETASDTF